jgi:hypothetical protein
MYALQKASPPLDVSQPTTPAGQQGASQFLWVLRIAMSLILGDSFRGVGLDCFFSEG